MPESRARSTLNAPTSTRYHFLTVFANVVLAGCHFTHSYSPTMV
jgi:hypothetical protein